MKQSKEEIIADMLANELLSDEDAKRYRTNKSVSVAELKEIKQLIKLCRSRENSKLYPFEETEKKIREKYFSKQSDESVTDSVIVGDDYSKEEQEAIEAIIRRGEEDMKNGRYSSFEESWKRIEDAKV